MRKIAILILAHRYTEQLRRMVQRLDCEYFDVYLHVDAKSNIAPFIKGLTGAMKTSKLAFVTQRIPTYLNDFSLVDATCASLHEAIEGDDYQYFALLTGQDYPIKSNQTIYETLTAAYPMSFIDMYGAEEAFRKGVQWVEHIGQYYYSQQLRKRMLRLVGQKAYNSKCGKLLRGIAVAYDRVRTLAGCSPREEIKDAGYVYSAGSHFWILPDVAAKHLLNVWKNDAKLNRIFHHIAAAEESYFQTALSTFDGLQLPADMYEQFESEEKEMDNPALRLIKWYENGVKTNGHPAIWNIEDVQTLSHARALFARKFDAATDSAILDYIDTQL